ncbi:MAG: ComEC/Rec2 family competence protein [Clostridia bacterium]|nr:ComEC/Rec2 family competence protein [Clostridia bacterium]
MHLLHNRPLATVACVFALTALFAARLSKDTLLIVGILLAFAVIVLGVWFFKRKSKTLFLILLCLLLSLIACTQSFIFFHVRYNAFQKQIGKDCEIVGTVISRDTSASYYSTFTVELESFNGKSCSGDFQLACSYASALQVGERFRATATAKAFEERTGYDEETVLLSDGILLKLECTDSANLERLPTEKPSLRILFAQWNAEAAFRLEESVGGEEGKLASALLLGNRDALSDEYTLAFRRAGISHLLALSGLHVSILIGILEWILRHLRCPKLARMIVTVIAALFYLFLTGCSPSTVRAVLMLCVLVLAFCLRASYDSFTGLCTVLTVLLILSPNAVLDVGMWMSFLAAGSIIVFSPALQGFFKRTIHKWPIPRLLQRILFGLIGALFVGTVANLALMLLQAHVFGELSLMSVPATMLQSIPMSATLLCAIVTMLFPILGGTCRFCAGIMLQIAHDISNIKGIVIPCGDAWTRGVLVVLTIVLIFLALAKFKRVWWSFLPVSLVGIAIATSFAVSHLPQKGIRMDYVQDTVGEYLLFTEHTHAVAVDLSCGSATGAYTLADLAAKARCTEIDDLILTHYHNSDAYVISCLSTAVKLRRLRLPEPQNDWEEGVVMRICEEAEAHGIEVRFDLRDLPIDGLKIRESMHTDPQTGEHTAILFSASVNGEEIVYVNAAASCSAWSNTLENALEHADHWLIGDTGYDANQKFPYTDHTPKTILIRSEALRSLIPYISTPDSVYAASAVHTYYIK